MKKKDQNLDYKDAFIRAQADYQNLVKEMGRKQEDWAKFANATLLTSLLPVIEHFHQGMKYVPEEQQQADWFVGFEQIKKQLDEFMVSNGLERLETVGQGFNPELHQSVGTRAEKGMKSNQILEEVQGGYTLHDKLIQPARVIIAE